LARQASGDEAKILNALGDDSNAVDIQIRQHAGAALVAAGIVAAALAQGLFEPTAYAAASVVIWAAVIAGLVGRGLPAAPIGRVGAVAGICLAATALLAMASVGWASDQGRAFEEAVRVSFYLGLFTLALCTASEGGRGQWLAGLTVGLGVVTLFGLFAYLQPGVLESGNQGGDVQNAVGRLSYPIGYWNGFAALLAVAAILLAYAGARAPTRQLRSAGTAALPLALLAIWLTDSRAGLVAAGIGLAVLVAASPDRWRQLLVIVIGAAAAAVMIAASEQMNALASGVNDAPRRADGDRLSAVAVVLTLLAGTAAWFLDGSRPKVRVGRRLGIALAVLAGLGICAAIVVADPPKRFREFKAPPAATAPGVGPTGAGIASNGRWQFWGEAIDAFESAPIAGVGAGGYEDWWARNAPVALFVRNPHSLPLQQAAELGLLGAALFLGFVAALLVGARRRLKEGLQGDAGVLIAVLVAACLCAAIDWTWEFAAVFGPAVAAAGLLLGSAPSRQLARNAYWLGAGTLATAWVAMIAGGLVVLSELELTQSRDAADRDQISEGINRAEDAHTVQPWSAEPYIQLALLDEQRGDPTQALVRVKQAEERDSEDWRLPLIEARLQAERGNQPAARMARERARNLSPLVAGL
jgi:hypothetical protein